MSQYKAKMRDEDGVSCAVCPHCKAEIYNLYAVDEYPGYYDFRVDDNGEVTYEKQDDIEPTAFFACPECDERVANTEEEAIDIFYERIETGPVRVSK